MQSHPTAAHESFETDGLVDQTTIRALVHKRLPENVFLTDIRALGGERFICTGRMPGSHELFNDGGRTPLQDVLFYTEVGRQASLAMTHAFLNASLDDVFIFERSEAAMMDAVWQLTSRSLVDPLVIEIAVRETTRRKHDAIYRVVADHLMTVGSEQVFRGTGTWTIQSAAMFTRLRRESCRSGTHGVPDAPRAIPIGPRRLHATNVVISTPEFRNNHAESIASLIVDRAHLYFFDHPCDHVPGMLLLEGCSQLALEAFAASHAGPSHATVMAYDMNFTQFVECDLPTTLAARLSCRHGNRPETIRHAVEVSVCQRGSVCGIATMIVGSPSERAAQEYA